LKLEEFLSSKPLAYKKIDLSRMPRAFESVKNFYQIPKTIHIIGTNGKGSTGRLLASALQKTGFRVGHFTSPHISRLNERFWKNGSEVSDELLHDSHSDLIAKLPIKIAKEVSYFEYTTLLNLPIFEDCDFLILEAGLGGEFDATNVFEKKISVFTPIGFDHTDFLGNSISEIAGTKLRAMSDEVVISVQKHPEVLQIAKEIAKEKNSKINILEEKKENYLEENFNTAMKALELLEVKNNFSLSDLEIPKGRFQRFSKNIIIDVGHNPLSAERVVENLKWKNFTLIYNSFSDKDYQKILEIFRPKTEFVEILEIQDERIVAKRRLEAILNKLKFKFKTFTNTSENKNYLVFGSFKVVEEFLNKN
jgi:dihydrofolate synthase/folylpolyglutamate synthase